MNNALPASATALPTEHDILEAYCEWLHMEKRLLNMELYPNDDPARNLTPCGTFADKFHFPHDGRSWQDVPKPSTRARTVLEAVGILEPEPADGDYLAALEFEPWKHEEGEWQPPTREQWAELADSYLFALQISWSALFQTKSELIEKFPTIDDATGKAMMELFIGAKAFFKAAFEMIETAELRILCAGSAYLKQIGQDGDEDETDEVADEQL